MQRIFFAYRSVGMLSTSLAQCNTTRLCISTEKHLRSHLTYRWFHPRSYDSTPHTRPVNTNRNRTATKEHKKIKTKTNRVKPEQTHDVTDRCDDDQAFLFMRCDRYAMRARSSVFGKLTSSHSCTVVIGTPRTAAELSISSNLAVPSLGAAVLNRRSS